jgi:fructose-1,6-bisphosphatase/inositol monophosphatase family enzyme
MRFDDQEIDRLCSLLEEVGAAEIMPRFRRLDDGDIRQKTSAIDLVTEADVNAERVITAELRRRYPSAFVIGEEAQSENPAILGELPGADVAFVLDPVDGTFNFAAGLPLFGVMLAVVVKGETVAGIIHDPVGKDFLMATKGGGAWLRRQGASGIRCRVAPAVDVSEMSGSVSWQFVEEPDRSRLTRNQAKFKAPFNYRCAAYEYRVLATGFGHFSMFMKLMPWDHLPGALIHAEAGGHVARLDGSAYTSAHVDGGLLAAPDKESWQAIRDTLYSD